MPVATPARRLALVSASVLALGVLPAPVQDLHNDPSSFNLFNDSSRVMISFAVQLTRGDYTANLLDTPMAPVSAGRWTCLAFWTTPAITRRWWSGKAESSRP